ncbi:Mss4-like protein [Mycena amicta]|nr:Mss4-like protein [Mycena amicta]
MAATNVTRLGSCLCKKIRFSVVGDPFSYAVCHCTNCKKFAGSAFMTNAFFSPDAFTVTEGKDALKAFADSDTTSGKTLLRSFCSDCGSSLFLTSPVEKNWIIVCPSGVDDAQEWTPRRENFPAGKLPWITALHIEPKRKPQL